RHRVRPLFSWTREELRLLGGGAEKPGRASDIRLECPCAPFPRPTLSRFSSGHFPGLLCIFSDNRGVKNVAADSHGATELCHVVLLLGARGPQYGSPTKIKVVPVTIGALAPTNDALASLTWRDPARPEAWSAPSMMCQRPWMRPVPRLPPKVLSGSSPSSSMRPSWMKSSASPSLQDP